MTDAGPSQKDAPLHPLPSTIFYSVEYPSLLVSPTAIPTAIETLGGQTGLDAAFRRDSVLKPIELNFRPGNPYAHPVIGDIVDSRSLVVKVVKRRRKRKAVEQASHSHGDISSSADGAAGREAEEAGIYTAEVVGKLTKMARFRAMADFSFQPQQPNRILDLRNAMELLDAKFIQEFEFGPELEDYTIAPDEAAASGSSTALPVSNMRLIPPPRFSSTVIPGKYDYKQNVASVPVTYIEESTGEEKLRYQNKSKPKGFLALTITFDDPDDTNLTPGDFPVLERVKKLFEERPIWSRLALLNQLTPTDARTLMNARDIYYLSAYTMSDGPFREWLIRWGYDPRKDPSSRFFQRLQFRNFQNEVVRNPVHRLVEGTEPPVRGAGQNSVAMTDAGEESSEQNRLSHIFDGKTLYRVIGSYQMCDIEDPLLMDLIHDESVVRKECHPTDGWYETIALDRIKAIARRKFGGLLEGRIVTDAECADLLTDSNPQIVLRQDLRKAAEGRKATEPKQGRVRKVKGKNMALVPTAPEEAATARLMKALQREQQEDPDEDDEDL